MSQHKGLSVEGTSGKEPVTGKVGQSLDQVISDMADVNIDSVWENGWEVIARESENQTASSPAISWGSSTATPGDSTGSQPETQHKNAHGSALEDSVGASNHNSDIVDQEPDDSSYDDDDELLDDNEYDLADDYYSDESEKSHDTRKKSKWLKPFFDTLDNLKDEQINDPNRRWHCPACYDGPGAIGWYKGLQSLLRHAKTRGSLRIKLHREFAELLEEEILRRGTSVVLAGELLGKWKGLGAITVDHEIVWPPMVVIMNTLYEKDEDDKWIGMGNQELIDYFSNYAAIRARHSYGPNGHCGMSVLIFEASVMGFVEAERLHKQFASEGRDRDAWRRHGVLFYPGGKRQLYGFLASKEDMDIFNQHSTGRPLVKFEMKSYQETVVVPLRQMMEDNQKLTWYKNKSIKQAQCHQALSELMEENRLVMLRTKMQYEENKEELYSQESFFKELMEEKREGEREELMKVEREKLIMVYKEKKDEMKRKHANEEIELKREFDGALSKLMDTCALAMFQTSKTV